MTVCIDVLIVDSGTNLDLHRTVLQLLVGKDRGGVAHTTIGGDTLHMEVG